MRVITKDEFMLKADKFLDMIEQGAVFIYPTDTIYGIGCNAMNDEAVQKIRELKDRSEAPFSVIAPSKSWIFKNCETPEEADEWLQKIPGPYTLVFKMKNKNCVAKTVTQGFDTLGVRQPKHWIMEAFEALNLPIVTTSVNKTGNSFMTCVEDMNSDIKSRVAFIIDEGERKANPSNIVHLYGQEVKIRDRTN